MKKKEDPQINQKKRKEKNKRKLSLAFSVKESEESQYPD